MYISVINKIEHMIWLLEFIASCQSSPKLLMGVDAERSVLLTGIAVSIYVGTVGVEIGGLRRAHLLVYHLTTIRTVLWYRT